MIKCFKCGNEDIRYFGIRIDGLYCRKCISFNGEEVDGFVSDSSAYKYNLNYKLSKEQKEISNKTLSAFKKKKDVLIHAVCGAGKTELVFECISYALKNKMNVGFVIPRKDVVIDLYSRFKDVFRDNSIVSVYGGNTKNLKGDIILLTTHQLYRYNGYFDLLIIDETDAFPFSGNDVLNNMFLKAVRGNYIMLSATPNNDMLELLNKRNGVYLKLLSRYHKHPLPVPKKIITIVDPLVFFIFYFRKFYVDKFQILVYVPTIKDGQKLMKTLKNVYKEGEFVSSKTRDRNTIIEDFKRGKYKYLITTSILERGITIPRVQVIVYKSDHVIFDKATLIQIAGRVGRKRDSPYGDVVFIAQNQSLEVEEAIKEIEEINNE